ncbi:ferric reductase-like transmembrane domain-containing protein [Yinghuangia seranimata]|uniref:ferric reductase-like transmembrane domain-containing protein n=1 Tax=Yinghuangia seranimata TaxID=408067 RepID=UPI00248B98B6|nr:ferric reductase-like transmembrane domain-containing protein [Yinghuangia seranimata]MDI2129466.1 ferric reductase-like transmembrane domain-containing protein [Yinghuangia seranimata]
MRRNLHAGSSVVGSGTADRDRRTRRRVPEAVVVAGCALYAFLAPVAHAATAPIPGSPLDAYDRNIPYDTGVHRIARLAALIAYVLMIATVVFGVMLRLRFMQRLVNRSTFYGAHMTLALTAVIFGGIHGLTFLYQPVWRIGWPQLTVPFLGGVQRVPVGLGILGTELAVAVACSVWLQRRLGYHRWLRTHQLAYAAFALIWLHIFLVHPEPRHLNPVAVGVAVGAGSVLLVWLIRILPSQSRLRQKAFTSGTGGDR